MKSIKLFLFACMLFAFMGVTAPLQAKTHISLNFTGLFPLFAPAPRTVVVHPCPAPCYKEVHVYPHGYREYHIYHPAPSPRPRIHHYPARSENFGIHYSRSAYSYGY